MSCFKASALRALIPKGSIDFLVDRFHVRKPIADVRAELASRFKAACETSPLLSGATKAQRARCARYCMEYAVKRHRDNRVAYITIMSQCSRAHARKVADGWR